MTRYGICNRCNDTPSDDIDTHISSKHRGAKPTYPELYSGTIECKICYAAINKPRLKIGDKEWDGEYIPKHDCKPAREIKDTSGQIVTRINELGMDVRHYQMVKDPTQ